MTKLKEMAVVFLAADGYHAVSKIEWRTKVLVEHGLESDTYSIDYELEWAKAVKHYHETSGVDLSNLDVFDVLAPYKHPIYGLKIAYLENKMPPNPRDVELTELKLV